MRWRGGVRPGGTELLRLAATCRGGRPSLGGLTKRAGFTPGALRHVLQSKTLELP